MLRWERGGGRLRGRSVGGGCGMRFSDGGNGGGSIGGDRGRRSESSLAEISGRDGSWWERHLVNDASLRYSQSS